MRADPPNAPLHERDVDLRLLVARKGKQRVSVCLPARNEATTVGPIVAAIRADLMERVPLVDEVLVIDDHSNDGTAAVAAAAGARVVQAAGVLSSFGEGHGKGAALWKSLYEAEGDLVVWCDSDIVDFDSRFVSGLLVPLLTQPTVGFVKGYYQRPASGDERGGRVTELVARPLLSMLFPLLATIVQPLSGEYAGRRSLLEQLPFVEGYGVDVGLVLDVVSMYGTDALAQVDLGTRVHRNRTLDELSPQATAVLQTVLHRAGLGERIGAVTQLLRPGVDQVAVHHVERPPLVTVPGYLLRSA
jgi:glucosyl-3-phosphoglycerate synthase